MKLPIQTQAFSIAKSIRSIMGLKLGKIGGAGGQDQFLACLDVVFARSNRGDRDSLQIRSSTVSKMTDGLVARELVERIV